MSRKADRTLVNRVKLREQFNSAWRAWTHAVSEAGVDLYSDAAEGKMIGRGKAARPDDLRRLYLAMEAARVAMGGEG